MNKSQCKVRSILRKEGYTMHTPGDPMPESLNSDARIYIIMRDEMPEILKLGHVPPFGAGRARGWDWVSRDGVGIVAWKVQ